MNKYSVKFTCSQQFVRSNSKQDALLATYEESKSVQIYATSKKAGRAQLIERFGKDDAKGLELVENN